MYEIYRMDTGEILSRAWKEDDATDIANDYEMSLEDVDVTVRYAKHNATDYASLFERMDHEDRIELYREGSKNPSIVIRRQGTLWKLYANGVVLTFDGMDIKPWNTEDLILTKGGRAVAMIENMSALEQERFGARR